MDRLLIEDNPIATIRSAAILVIVMSGLIWWSIHTALRQYRDGKGEIVTGHGIVTHVTKVDLKTNPDDYWISFLVYFYGVLFGTGFLIYGIVLLIAGVIAYFR